MYLKTILCVINFRPKQLGGMNYLGLGVHENKVSAPCWCFIVFTHRIQRMGCVCPQGLPHVHPTIPPLHNTSTGPTPFLGSTSSNSTSTNPMSFSGVPQSQAEYPPPIQDRDRVPPPPPPPTNRDSVCLLCGGRYASCVHARGVCC